MIRPVRDRSELANVFDLLGAQFPESFDISDWRLDYLAVRFSADQPLMVVATADAKVVGGTLAGALAGCHVGFVMSKRLTDQGIHTRAGVQGGDSVP